MHLATKLQAQNEDNPVSSRAITEENLRAIYEFNRAHHHWNANEDDWGGGRARQLVDSVSLLATWCLLRGAEVLKLQVHTVEPVSETCLKITPSLRKTQQYGGKLTNI